MRKMKDSGIEYIKEIPNLWEVKKIKYCANEENEVAYMDPENSDYIGLENVVGYNNQIIKTDAEYGISFQKKCHKGNILFGKLRPYLAKSIIVANDCFCSSEFLELSNYVGDSRFLRYVLIYPPFIDEVNMSTYGAKMPRANTDFIINLKIPQPPKKEQNKIADFLDSKCAQIDVLSEKIQSQIQLLEDYKKSVVTEAVTKGLNRNVPMKDSGVEWAQEIPHHWQAMPNKYIMEKIKVICSKRENEDIISLSINGVIVRDLDAGGKMPSSFDGYQYVYPGNLLMCLFDYDVTPRCIGLINDFGLTSPAYSQFVMKNHNCSKYYYYYYLMLDYTKELLHLAKNLRHSFTEEQLGMIKAPVPPISEQKQIADYLDERTAQIDGQVEKCREQLEVLAAYKKSLIYEYVTGKKVIK